MPEINPPFPLRERILLYGPWGTGKTYAWLTIAKLHQQLNSPAVFYAIDTDDGVERLLYGEFPSLKNVVVEHVFEWKEYVTALKRIRANAKHGDWVIVDMVSMVWEEAQSEFIREVFGSDPGDYFLRVRKNMELTHAKGSVYQEAMDGWRDWGQINKMYQDFIKPLAFGGVNAHVFATARADTLDNERDKTNRLMFGPIGLKPQGQKHLGYQFHTVIMTTRPTASDYTMTTAKDRGGRPLFDATRVSSFGVEYLMQRAGWTVK